MLLTINFLIKCFILGIIAGSGLGFVISFNRSAVHGFWHGFFAGLGTALGDTLLFFLALSGLLTILGGTGKFVLIFDLLGGVLLVMFGLKMLRGQQPAQITAGITSSPHLMISMLKSFLVMTLNPTAILFFLIASMQVVPVHETKFSLLNNSIASITVGLGSLSLLTIVSLLGRILHRLIRSRHLKQLSIATGVVFIGLGIYFLSDVVIIFIHSVLSR